MAPRERRPACAPQPPALERARLHGLLDGLWSRRALWLAAPPGAGKRTLLRQHLAARGLDAPWVVTGPGCDAAAVLARAAGPVVLEGADRLPEPEAAACIDAIAARPAVAGPAVLLAEGDPPGCVGRLAAQGALAFVAADALRWTVEEIAALAQRRGVADADAAALAEETGGWSAAVAVLLAAHPGWPAAAPERRHLLDAFVAQDYLALLAPDELALLQALALVRGGIDAVVAAAVTGDAQAGARLGQLAARGRFVLRVPGTAGDCMLLPAVRQVLARRLAAAPPALADLQRRTGLALSQAGRHDEALEHLVQAGALQEAEALIARTASPLLTAGELAGIGAALRALPADPLAARPWMAYWKAVAMLGHGGPENLPLLEQAWQAFAAARDAAGQAACVSAAVNGLLMRDWRGLGPVQAWMERGFALLEAGPGLAGLPAGVALHGAVLSAAMFCRPTDARVEWLLAQARALLERVTAPDQVAYIGMALAHVMVWSGRTAEMPGVVKAVEQAHENGALSAQFRVAWHYTQAMVDGFTRNAPRAAAERIGAAARLAAAHGLQRLPIYCSHYATLLASAFPGALEADPEHAAHRARERSSVALRMVAEGDAEAHAHWRAGRLDAGSEAMRRVLGVCASEGWNRRVAVGTLGIGLAEALAGRPAQAGEALQAAAASGLAAIGPWFPFGLGLLEATIALQAQDAAAAMPALRRALALGREHRYLHALGFWSEDALARACAAALAADIEPAYVRDLVRARALSAPPGAAEAWPWPVRIRTLGTFSLVLDDQPLPRGRKEQRKPLELLKALVACGGTDVPSRRLADLVWPEAEGDTGLNALHIAVHRLRRLLAPADALRIDSGRLSLDRAVCDVDLWRLKALVARAEALVLHGGERHDAAALAALAGELLAAYPGRFLAAEDDLPWLPVFQDRWHLRVTRLLAHLVDRLEQDAGPDRAGPVWDRLLDLDPAADAAWRGLLRCLLARGRADEARSAAARCERALRDAGGGPPSAALLALLAQVRAAARG